MPRTHPVFRRHLPLREARPPLCAGTLLNRSSGRWIIALNLALALLSIPAALGNGYLLYPTEDTFVQQDSPNSSNGGKNALRVNNYTPGQEDITYWKFEFNAQELDINNPTSASMRVVPKNGSGEANFYYVPDTAFQAAGSDPDWSGTSLTWNNQPDQGVWRTATYLLDSGRVDASDDRDFYKFDASGIVDFVFADESPSKIVTIAVVAKSGNGFEFKTDMENSLTMGGQNDKWRVIPYDERFSTDDAIVALCAVDDTEVVDGVETSKFGLPDDPANTDCTAAFQRAIDYAYGWGGGTVWVPEGAYRIDGPLIVMGQVRLRGQWRPLTEDQAFAGTLIRLGMGPFTGLSPIAVRASGSIKGLTFHHPNQNNQSPIQYPFAVAGDGGSHHLNLTFLNAYRGLGFENSSGAFVDGIYGSPLAQGLYAGKADAIPRFLNVNFSPDYYAWSGMAADASDADALRAYARANGVAIEHNSLAGFNSSRHTISGYRMGVSYTPSDHNRPHGYMADLKITDCDYALHFSADHGVRVKDGEFHASQTTIYSVSRFQPKNCSFRSDPGGLDFKLIHQDLTLFDCEWSGDPAKMDLGSGVLDERTSSHIELERPHSPEFEDSYFVRKPSHLHFYNVVDYGAVGDNKVDDTAAILAAIQAAQDTVHNAGEEGIVFFPEGQFRIATGFRVPDGVELQGNGRSRLVITSGQGGGEDDPPFLVLGERSGIRGMEFHYTDQTGGGTTGDFIRYPFTIHAAGYRNYLIDCRSSNPYHFIKYTADDSLTLRCNFGGLHRMFQVEGVNRGLMDSVQIKPTFWTKGDFENIPDIGKSDFKKNVTTEGLQTFVFKDSSDFYATNMFHHEGYKVASFENCRGNFGGCSGERFMKAVEVISGSEVLAFDGGMAAEGGIGPDGTWERYGVYLHEAFTGKLFCNDGSTDIVEDHWIVEGGTLIVSEDGVGARQGDGVASVRIGKKGTLYLESFNIDNKCGIDNQGVLKMKDVNMQSIRPHEAQIYGADNSFSYFRVFSDTNQIGARNYSLVMDETNVEYQFQVEDYRALLTNGDDTFHFRFDNPFDAEAFNNSPHNVFLYVWMWGEPGDSVRVWYRDRNGNLVLDDQSLVEWAGDSGSDVTQKIKLNGNPSGFGRFPGQDDIRIEILSGAPRLGAVWLETNGHGNFAPQAPTGLVAGSIGPMASLDWDDHSDSDVTYTVYRRLWESGVYDEVFASGLSQSHLDLGDISSERTKYSYTVTAVDAQGLESQPSFEAHIGWVRLTHQTGHAEADAFVRGGVHSAQAYGNESELHVSEADGDDHRNLFIRFPIPNVPGDLRQARLRLRHIDGAGSHEHRVYLVDQDGWSESSLTMDSSIAAGMHPDAGEIPLDSATTQGGGSWIEFDVTQAVISEAAGDGWITFMVESADSSLIRYHARESADANHGPQLILSTSATPFQQWAGTHGMLDVAASGDETDSDGGSLDDIMEYAFGGDPANSQDDREVMPVMIVETMEGAGETQLSYGYIERKQAASEGIRYVVEYSHNLTDWMDEDVTFLRRQEVDAEHDRVTVTVPVAERSRIFVRCLVELR